MLIAEIRRKLPNLEDIDPDSPEAVAQIRGLLRETKEDLLTADVFGVLKYLPRQPYLDSVLVALSARNPASEEFHAALPSIRLGIQNVVFRFWPNYATPSGLGDGRTEPDVEISNAQTLLFFEAKLFSRFGDRQLERELAVAAEEAKGRHFFLILVTPGSKPPRFRHGTARLQAPDYLAAVVTTDDLPGNARDVLVASRHRVLWISWEAIHTTLKESHEKHRVTAAQQGDRVQRAADMLADLNALMLLRQIQPFTGFVGLGQVPIGAESGTRPVLLRLAARQTGGEYRLTDAVRIAPQTFGWRCPASRLTRVADTFIPCGTCGKSWPLAGDGPLFRLRRAEMTAAGSWNLTRALRRWPPLSGTSGIAFDEVAGRSHSGKTSERRAGGYRLQQAVERADLPAAKSGFGIHRSKT